MKPKLLTTLRGYTPAQFRADVVAGITVALIAIPLSLAIAIASGANPAAGLVSAIIGGFLISLLGGSKVQIGGPTGAFIVVVYGVIAAHGFAGLILATLMAGVILVLAGLLRLGNLIEYVPEPVVNGFTIGIAVIIASSQLKDLLGLDIPSVPAEFLPKIAALWSARASLDPAALVTGLIALMLIIALRRLFPKWPGLIFAMAAVSFGVAVMHLPVETITSRFGILPSHLPAPFVPDINLALLRELLPSALVIAFLAAIESLLSAMVADRMIEGSHRPNAEVMAQGWANIATALFGGLPVTGAIARTATNVRAGGQTPVAGLVHAVVIFGIMLVAAPYAGYLAMPALAAILLTTAWNMSEPHRWPQYWAAPMADRVLLLLTMVLTVLADLTTAIGVGVALGLALRLREKGLPPAPWSGRD